MRNVIRLLILGILIYFGNSIWSHYRNDDSTKGEISVNKDESVIEKIIPGSQKKVSAKTSFILNVPYISEAPEGNWSGDWVNACEEATIAMVDNYYKEGGTVTVTEAKNYLQRLFDEEDKLYGHNKNTDARQILELISLYTSFDAEIKTNPTIGEIKEEVLNGRPVISLHRGFDLNNPNIPFSPVKSSYHTVVVVGFDDTRQEFITHDPGDENDGPGHRYSYKDFMYSLHDYNKEADKTDGVPTVIFTERKN